MNLLLIIAAPTGPAGDSDVIPKFVTAARAASDSDADDGDDEGVEVKSSDITNNGSSYCNRKLSSDAHYITRGHCYN